MSEPPRFGPLDSRRKFTPQQRSPAKTRRAKMCEKALERALNYTDEVKSPRTIWYEEARKRALNYYP